MYNLAKLLTDEPAKLERLIILFIKLLITFSFTCLFLGYKLPIQSFIKEPLPDSFSATGLAYFLVCMIILWFGLWSVISDLLLGEFLVRLIAWPFNKRWVLLEILSPLGIAENRNGHLYPKKNIALFVESIKNPEESDSFIFIDENHARVRQYFGISVLTFILFSISKEIVLTKIENWLGILIIINFLTGSVIVHIVKEYVYDNHETFVRELQPLAYIQMTKNILDETEYFKKNYDYPKERRRMNLKRKKDHSNCPEEIDIETAYHWNQDLGQHAMIRMLKAEKDRRKTKEDLKNVILITNIKPTEEMGTLVKEMSGLTYVYATNEEEIFSGLELSAYHIEWRSHEEYIVAQAQKTNELPD